MGKGRKFKAISAAAGLAVAFQGYAYTFCEGDLVALCARPTTTTTLAHYVRLQTQNWKTRVQCVPAEEFNSPVALGKTDLYQMMDYQILEDEGNTLEVVQCDDALCHNSKNAGAFHFDVAQDQGYEIVAVPQRFSFTMDDAFGVCRESSTQKHGSLSSLIKTENPHAKN